MHRKQRGLTFVELMIAVAVLAVVLTVAIPAFGRFVQENRVTASANTVVAHLNFARHQAVFSNTNVAVCPSTNGRECTGGNRWDGGFIVYADANNSRQPDSLDNVLRVVGPDDRLVMHSAGRFRVRFQRHGGAYGTNLTIRVCDPAELAGPRAIIVSNPGRIRSERDIDPAECEL